MILPEGRRPKATDAKPWNGVYFKQIEMGPMQNFVYLVGSLDTRKAAVVDAAWDIEEILRIVAEDEMELTHAFVSHTHPDHIGANSPAFISKESPSYWRKQRSRSSFTGKKRNS